MTELFFGILLKTSLSLAQKEVPTD